MRPGTLYVSQRVSFSACGCSGRVALSPLRSGGGAAPFSSCSRTRFHVAGRSGDPGPGPRSVPLRARARSDRAGIESLVSRRVGSRKAGANADGTWHAAHVSGIRGRQTGGTHFWKVERAQGAGTGCGNDQRASSCAPAGSWGRTTPGDEPLTRPGGGSGQTVRRKSDRVGRVGYSAAVTGCSRVVG